MAQLPPPDIRATLLSVIHEQQPRNQMDGSLQTSSVLNEAARRIGTNRHIGMEQALLTQLHDLFRTGYLAWGLNLSNPDPPFFHIAEAGRSLLSGFTRDPGNPDGYRAHLYATVRLNDIARSYLDEGVECYVNGLYKASAVMVGASAESLILELGNSLIDRLRSLSRQPPKDLSDWRVKKVLEAIHGCLSRVRADLPPSLREEFESYWPAFAQQIRTARNDAGHPATVDPVTQQTVQASLLIFPEMAELQNRLVAWVSNEMK